jgi:hypothetical protein
LAGGDSRGATEVTTGTPAATAGAPVEGVGTETAAGGGCERRTLGDVATRGDVWGGGVVQRLMIAGTWRWCVGGTLLGAPEGIPFPTSKARTQIWNDEIIPATTRAIQMTQENQFRIGRIIAVQWDDVHSDSRNVRQIPQAGGGRLTMTRFFPSRFAR